APGSSDRRRRSAPPWPSGPAGCRARCRRGASSAAASSSFQAGPALLRALARRRLASDQMVGVLAGWLGMTNRHHTPYWGVVLYTAMSAAVVLAAAAQDQ